MFKPFEAFEVITAILKPLSLIIENIWAHSSHSPDQVKELLCTILKSVDEALAILNKGSQVVYSFSLWLIGI